MTRTLGAILAGGRSSRFGADKADALLDGRRLIDWAADALGRQVDALVVCGRDDPRYRCVPDRPAPDLGPLGGVAAALHHAGRTDHDWIVTLPCDTPRPPPNLVATLALAEGAAFLAAMPVIGRWHRSMAGGLDRHLADPAARRSVRGWALAAGASPVAIDRTIANVNTPADLAALVRAE